MRTKFSLFCLFVALCATLAHAKLNDWNFQAVSVRSHIFESLRPKGNPEVIKECGSVVTKPYGQLEQVYKRGQVAADATCTWKLRAPANHRINIISVGFDLLDAHTDTPSDYDSAKTSGIFLYNSEEAGKGLMTMFYTSPKEHGSSSFVNSISSQENMVVEVKYHDNIDYDTQNIKIKYEFLPVDKMQELLNKYH
ncbi:uncharacterized protein LOC100123346 [Nasonia vitripennis]|uniref:CUB domain-containing protein n=1 Tax=Nasonia vitripennis TaxID=7425 RepID=A0A7M7G9Y2_NASVI|nr:uncharacterized protein LOC100123346 [Nasonia vitripennis]